MANVKISNLTAASTPVAGTEVLPIVQSGATVKVSIANLTPGLDTITAAKGGTGQTSYAVGDLLYASTTTALSKLADVATGNALISGGVNTAPSWGKIGLTTHVSGTLPTANGGTGLTSFTANGVVYASSSSALTTGSALVFDGSNLGLGVTPSAWALSGQKVLQVLNASLSAYTNDEATLSGNAYHYGSGWKYISSNYAEQYVMAGGAHKWYNAASGTAGNAITFTQAMTLDASGNLGIGTTSPALRIHGAVSGTAGARIENTAGTGAAYWQAKNTATTCQFGVDANGGYVETSGAYSTIFYTNGSERARIDSSGNLLVGQTSAGTASSGFSVGGGLVFASIPSGNNTYHVWDGTNSAYRFYVSAAGTISATNTTITSLSDVRLKENIRDLDDGLNVVMGLKPRKFDWKTGKGKDIKNDRGFIAQEFELVLPDMIHEWLDNAPEGEEPYKAINANLIPTLVKAIQEQQALITQLTARITALESA